MDLKSLEQHGLFNDSAYVPDYSNDDTIGDIIFNFLFNKNKVVQLNDLEDISTGITENYKKKIDTQVSKGAPINMFLTTFSPKFKLEQRTNFYIHPDISDLLTLIHLQKIAKSIKDIYPYSFRFFIIFKGDLYKNLGFWSKYEVNKTFELLKKLNKIAEEITGVRNTILLYRWNDFMGKYDQLFKETLYDKTMHYFWLWQNKKEPYYTQIEKWKKDFGKYFHNEHKDPFFVEFFTKEACKIRALNNLVFREGDFLSIIDDMYPNLLIAHTRRKSKFFSLNLNPQFRNLTHFYLSTLENRKWGFDTWENIKSDPGYQPKYIDGFDYPMYFEKK